MTKTKQPKPDHYVNNAQFSAAVLEYTKQVKTAKENQLPIPIVPNYIAECFLKISEGLSHKVNFVRYTYKEEMVMDGVENCLRAIGNYDPDIVTRTGNPNAFAYFTQIVWYAFLRRIAKEKKHADIKQMFLSESNISDFVTESEHNEQDSIKIFLDILNERIDNVRKIDKRIKEMADENSPKRKGLMTDSDLNDFFEN